MHSGDVEQQVRLGWKPDQLTEDKDMGQRITDEINSDPEEVARLRRAIEQSRAGKRRRLDDAMPDDK